MQIESVRDVNKGVIMVISKQQIIPDEHWKGNNFKGPTNYYEIFIPGGTINQIDNQQQQISQQQHQQQQQQQQQIPQQQPQQPPQQIPQQIPQQQVQFRQSPNEQQHPSSGLPPGLMRSLQ